MAFFKIVCGSMNNIDRYFIITQSKIFDYGCKIHKTVKTTDKQ